MRAIAESQLSGFAASLGRAHRLDLRDAAALHDFSVTRFRDFWRHLLGWSSLRWEGSCDRVCVGDLCETAAFFPDLRLNYAENALATGESRPLAPAISCWHSSDRRTVLTHAELKARVEREAALLRALGVGVDDRVVAVLRSDTEAVVAALAVAAVGASLATASPEMGAEALIARFEPLAPRLLMAHVGVLPHDTGVPLASRVAQVAAALPSLALLIAVDDASAQLPANDLFAHVAVHDLSAALALHPRGELAWQRFAFNQPLFVMSSSGAAGRPNCVVHGAGGTLLEHVKEHRLHVDLQATDRLFIDTSCASAMWPWQLSALASGCQLVLYDGPPLHDANTLWRILQDEKVTVFGTSSSYLELSEHAGLAPGKEFDLSSLRAVLSVGSPLGEAAFAWIGSHVKHVPVQSISAGPDILGCFVLSHPHLPIYAGEFQSRSLGMDVRALAAADPSPGDALVGELVCANPFPSRPLGFFGDADGSGFHASYFVRHPGMWADGDRVELMPGGGASLHARADGQMNVQGVRWGPAELYAVLREFEPVREAVLVEQRMPGAFGEGRAVLLVVLGDGASLDGPFTARLRRRLVQAVSAAHVPALILQVPELPHTHTGHVSESAVNDAVNGLPVRQLESLRNPESLETIRDALALRTFPRTPLELAPPPAPGWRSRKDHESYLQSLWERVFGFSPISLDDDFFALGGHPLMAARMFADIKRSTGQSLTLATLLKAPTLRQLAGVVDAAAWQLPVPLVQLRRGTGRPLFLMHSLAGTFLELSAVVRALDTQRPVYGLQPRGLGAGQPPHLRVADMASDYIGHMRRVQPQGPYDIAGYSFGGLIAFEIAQQLQRAGESVGLLSLIDTHVHGRYTPLAQWLKHRFARVTGTLHNLVSLPRRRRLIYLQKISLVFWDRIRARFGLPPKRPELVGDVVREANFPPALRRVRGAMLVAMRDYCPQPYAGRVVYLRASVPGPLDPLLFWRKVVRGGLDVIVTPGNHDEIIAGANAHALAHALARQL